MSGGRGNTPSRINRSRCVSKSVAGEHCQLWLSPISWIVEGPSLRSRWQSIWEFLGKRGLESSANVHNKNASSERRARLTERKASGVTWGSRLSLPGCWPGPLLPHLAHNAIRAASSPAVSQRPFQCPRHRAQEPAAGGSHPGRHFSLLSACRPTLFPALFARDCSSPSLPGSATG